MTRATSPGCASWTSSAIRASGTFIGSLRAVPFLLKLATRYFTMKVLSIISGLATLASATPGPRQWQNKRATAAAPAYAAHTIDQPVCMSISTKSPFYSDHEQIDHFPTSDRYEPHTNATFKQRYFFDSSYYKPGGPVFLYIGGETSGESRFSNLQTGSRCLDNQSKISSD